MIFLVPLAITTLARLALSTVVRRAIVTRTIVPVLKETVKKVATNTTKAATKVTVETAKIVAKNPGKSALIVGTGVAVKEVAEVSSELIEDNKHSIATFIILSSGFYIYKKIKKE